MAKPLEKFVFGKKWWVDIGIKSCEKKVKCKKIGFKTKNNNKLGLS